jgi:TRAP-type mannitol/chloroaromatic compound transport system substrate-binding protein
MEAALEASLDLYEQQAAADAGYRKLYEAWSRARRDSYRWFDTAETAFAAFAFPRAR